MKYTHKKLHVKYSDNLLVCMFFKYKVLKKIRNNKFKLIFAYLLFKN